MGLFDKLKAATNAITGGAAVVQLEIQQGSLSQGVVVKVHGHAKANVRITSVYIDFIGTEHARVRGVKQHSHLNSMGNTGDVNGAQATAQQRFTISGPQDLVEGQSYTWDANCALPHGGMPSFQGQTIGYAWTARAGIDTPGNDPHTGFVAFVVVP